MRRKSRRWGNSGGFFCRGQMNYQTFTNDALAADDEFRRFGGEPKFGVRTTPEWKTHAGALEAEMLKRGMLFQIIDWSEHQGARPLGG